MTRFVSAALPILAAAVLTFTGTGCGPCVPAPAPMPATQTACANNLRQIGIASQLYLNEHQTFPFAGKDATGYGHIQLLFDERWLDATEVVVCPTSADTMAMKDSAGKCTLGPTNCSYLWANKPRTDKDPLTLPLAADKAQAHGASNGRQPVGRMVLFLDGRVKLVPGPQFMQEIQPHLTSE